MAMTHLVASGVLDDFDSKAHATMINIESMASVMCENDILKMYLAQLLAKKGPRGIWCEVELKCRLTLFQYLEIVSQNDDLSTDAV